MLMGCADDALTGQPDASPATGSSAFTGADRAIADAASASRDASNTDEDTRADAGTSTNAAAIDPFRCRTGEPCGVVVVAVPGDCASRMPLPCVERNEASLASRLLRSCRYDPSYNPLELVFEVGCVTTFRISKDSKADHPEVTECLARELGSLRFECADGGRLLLYRDTLALP
jgi:hypothetical protein